MVLTDDQKKKLQGAIREISNSMTRTEAERDLIREIVKDQSLRLTRLPALSIYCIPCY